MQTRSAYTMIARAGSALANDPQYHRGLIARFGYYNIELTDQDGQIIAIKVVPAHERPEQVSDYFPGTYFPSLTRAIQYVIPRQIDGNPREVISMGETKGTHGGPRTAGPGKKMGRPGRSEPKSTPIWCGQISDEERELIMTTLTPEERREALLQAVQKKKKQ